MNTKSEIDLQLHRLKKGQAVVGIAVDQSLSSSSKIKYYGVLTIIDFYEKTQRWRYGHKKSPKKVVGTFAVDGTTRPNFYFSANPKHIQAAEKAAQKRKAIKEAKDVQDENTLLELQGKLKSLLEEYNADIHAYQIAGDDQGVELEVYLSLNSCDRCVVIE